MNQPLPADQLQSRTNRPTGAPSLVRFDEHGRRIPTHAQSVPPMGSTFAAAAAPSPASTSGPHPPRTSQSHGHHPGNRDNRDNRKRSAGDAEDARRRVTRAQQPPTSVEYSPSAVKRQRRESPASTSHGDRQPGSGSSAPARRSSTDGWSHGQRGQVNHGSRSGRRGSESPIRGGDHGGQRDRGGGRIESNRYPLPPGPRKESTDQSRGREHASYERRSSRAYQSQQPQAAPLAPASPSTTTASSGPHSSPQRLPLPLPSRPSRGPSSTNASLPPKPVDAIVPQLATRPPASSSSSSASYTIFSDSDVDVVESTPATLSALYNDDDGKPPSLRVELQYNQSRLPTPIASSSTQFNRRASSVPLVPSGQPPSSAAAAAAAAAAAGGGSAPPVRGNRTPSASNSSRAAARSVTAIVFPEINYPAYSASAGSALAPSGSRRGSVDDDNAPSAQLLASVIAQRQQYLDLMTQLAELDDHSSELDEQIAALVEAKNEIDTKRRDLLQQLRSALDEDPVTSATPPETPVPRANGAPPPAAPASRQTPMSVAFSASNPTAPGSSTAHHAPSRSALGVAAPATGNTSTAPSPLRVTRTYMIDKITTRKPRALVFHPQPQSDLVVTAFLDGGLRFFDTSRRTLVHRCALASIDPTDPGSPNPSLRVDAMRFVGANHIVAIHENKPDAAQMSMITVDREGNGARQITTKHHHFGITLYDRETSAVASDRDPSIYRFATAGKDEKEGWRVHLWSLRQPVEGGGVDGRYPHVLRPADHFQVYEVPATHTSRVHSMVLEDSNLYTSGFDGRLQWIDLTVQQPMWKTQLKGKKLTQILSSPTDPNLLYVTCADPTAQFRVIDRRLVRSTPELSAQLQFGYNTGGSNLSQTLTSAVDPHMGTHFVSGSSHADQKGTVLSWDVRFISSHPKATYWEPTEQMQLGHSGRVEVVQFSPHSHSLATLGFDYRLGLHSLGK